MDGEEEEEERDCVCVKEREKERERDWVFVREKEKGRKYIERDEREESGESGVVGGRKVRWGGDDDVDEAAGSYVCVCRFGKHEVNL